jgi:glycosyltransferase involved in cell wall biosynthesis
MDLSVVVPVHNEAENIAPLVAEIVAALDGKLAFEIVYVDDGSSDGTAAALAEAARTHPQLRVIRHDVCSGQSRAVVTGIKAAKAPVVATLDGDGQNDPASIADLWARMTATGAPDPNLVVCGHRKSRKDTGWRRFASKVGNGIRSALLHDRTPDSGCGLKVFAREAFLDLPRFDHMHRFLPPLFLRQGREVVSVEVKHRPRERGTSKYGVFDRLWVGIWDLLGVMWLQRRSRYPGQAKEIKTKEANVKED